MDLIKYKEIPKNLLDKLIYPLDKIKNCKIKNNGIYADFIASGRPSPFIENYIIKNIYGKYSNTHSNASNGIFMNKEIQNVKEIIKKEYNLNDKYKILFKGSGVTTCINYLIECIDFIKYKKVYIFISEYEHFSNHLPWVELAKKNNNINICIIPLNYKNELDIEWYKNEIFTIKNINYKNILIITSITHCSNLTGYFTPLKEIKNIINNYKKKNIESYLFTDMACSAPYKKIDGSIFDAFFISPHKFIGGIETPGILVAKICLFQKKYSVNPGGSCIKKTCHNYIEYSEDIEIRENAGTPNIVGIIKIGQCVLMKQTLQKLITYNEHILYNITQYWFKYFSNKYTDFFYIKYEKETLPIFSFHLKNLHYNFIVVLLNDLYGIQSRGGISCDGLLNDYIIEKYHLSGFCRISLHWTMTKKNIQKIFNAIEFIIKNGEMFLSKYTYNKEKNLWTKNV